MSEKRDLVIIGGGPGGYVAALRASQLRKKVTVIEEDRIGGTCMNYGCIPTKFLLSETKLWRDFRKNPRIEEVGENARLNWKGVQQEKRAVVDRLVRGIEFLLERNGIEVLKGRGELKSERTIVFRGEGGETSLEAERIILATGGRSSELPALRPDGQAVITHLEALELEDIPRSLLVVGAGAIGLEIGTVFSRLGTEVTILEIMPTILPGMDRQMAVRLERMLKKQGLEIFTEMRLEESRRETGAVRLSGTCLKTQKPFDFAAEKVLLAAGRRPNSEFLGDGFGTLLDRSGFVKVNAKLETSVPGISAIGDLIGGKLLAHKASHEGVIAAENAAGGYGGFYRAGIRLGRLDRGRSEGRRRTDPDRNLFAPGQWSGSDAGKPRRHDQAHRFRRRPGDRRSYPGSLCQRDDPGDHPGREKGIDHPGRFLDDPHPPDRIRILGGSGPQG